MKSLILIQSCFIAFLFSSCCTEKQTMTQPIAISAGPTMSSISGESYEKPEASVYSVHTEFTTILCPGLFSPGLNSCDCGIDEKDRQSSVFIRTGLGYYGQGGAYKEENGFSGKVTTSYLTVPFLLRYQSGKGFFAETGLRGAYLLSAKDKYDGNTDDYKSHFKKFDLGIPFGLGYKFKNQISIGAEVIPGIINIDKEKDDAEDAANKNFSMNVKLSYWFGAKKKD